MDTAGTPRRHSISIHTESAYSISLSDAPNAASALDQGGFRNLKHHAQTLSRWIHGFTAVTRDKEGCSSKTTHDTRRPSWPTRMITTAGERRAVPPVETSASRG